MIRYGEFHFGGINTTFIVISRSKFSVLQIINTAPFIEKTMLTVNRRKYPQLEKKKQCKKLQLTSYLMVRN